MWIIELAQRPKPWCENRNHWNVQMFLLAVAGRLSAAWHRRAALRMAVHTGHHGRSCCCRDPSRPLEAMQVSIESELHSDCW